MRDPSQPSESVPDLEFDASRPDENGAAADRLRIEPAGDRFPLLLGDNAIHILDYVRVLHRRRWVAITAFLVVLLSTLLYVFTAVPQYEGQTQILIENENPNVTTYQEVADQNKTNLDYYQTQYRILQSRSLVKRTLDAEKLWNNPLFAAPPPTNLFSWFHPQATVSAAPDATESVTQSRAIDVFLRHLTVAPVRNSRLVDIRFESPDPQLSAKVANAIARAYLEQSLELKSNETKDATDFLKERMGEQRQAVEQSELAMQRYREQTDSVSLEDRQNIVVQRLADLNSAVTRARTERLQKEAAWNQVRAVQNDRAALDTHPLILSNSFIQQLKGELASLQQQQAQLSDKLGDKHPDMVKIRSAIANTDLKIQAETAKVVQSIRNDYEAALAQERSLNTALDQQKTEAMDLNRQSIQYGVLQRDAASNKQIFDGLLNRSKETGIEGESRSSNIRVVDVAEVPSRPASPQKLLATTFGVFGGALFGIALAFFFEYLDNRVKRPDELAAYGLPFLGIVPLVRSKVLRGSPLLINGSAPHSFAEAIRGIRTNVLFSFTETGCRTLVITSTAPTEGKTIISSNFAASLALAGQRVLLIDADLRRPKAHEMFDMAAEPGLSNVLVGTARASEAVRRDGRSRLYVLPAGRVPPNPAELLGSTRFRDLLQSMKAHFDWVIIDSPPVMAVADAAVIAHISDGVIFVVGAEMTNRNMLKVAVRQMAAARAKILGAVLNFVDIERNAYYYSTYYRRDYTDYYTRSQSVSTEV